MFSGRPRERERETQKKRKSEREGWGWERERERERCLPTMEGGSHERVVTNYGILMMEI